MAAPGAGAIQSPVALLLGPCREAMSGVSTHLNLLFASRLAEKFRLVHFQVGREGRDEREGESSPRRPCRSERAGLSPRDGPDEVVGLG